MDTATPTPASLPHLPADDVRAVLSPGHAADALAAALREGLDPEQDAPRTRVETSSGTLLQMPSTRGSGEGTQVGVKLLTLTEDNPTRGLPSIQGVYVLFGGAGQSPRAVLDGTALTAVRTAAVSVLAARLLVTAPPRHVVVFGTGVQAWEHAAAFAEAFSPTQFTVVGRDAGRAAALAARIQADLRVAAAPGEADAVAEADVVLTCTASPTPLFDGALVPDHATVVAMGAHTPDAREVDDALLRRASVAVESRDSALRESGEVVQGIASGAVREEELLTLADLARGQARRAVGAPAVAVTTGMPWQDLVVAAAVADAAGV